MKLTQNTQGFTLVEIIITLTLMAIAGAMMATYLQSAAPQSALGLVQFKNRNQLQAAMEKINQAYRQDLGNPDFTLENFRDKILEISPLVHGEGTKLLTLQPQDPVMLLVTLEKDGQRVSNLFSQ